MDVLPGKEASPTHPFSGFVLNLNIVTRAHRDVKDQSCCLILVMGEHVGGELCLVVVLPKFSSVQFSTFFSEPEPEPKVQFSQTLNLNLNLKFGSGLNPVQT